MSEYIPITEENKEKIEKATNEITKTVVKCVRKYGVPETLTGLAIVTLAGIETVEMPFDKFIELLKKIKEKREANQNGE